VTTKRRIIAVLAVLALLGVSAAYSSSNHFHSKSPGQCDICYTAHVVSAASATITAVLFHVPDERELLFASEDAAGYVLPALRRGINRGPPSLV
jgi:hypothetical protein